MLDQNWFHIHLHVSYSPIIGPDFTHVHCHLFTTDDSQPIAAIFLFEPTSQLSVVCDFSGLLLSLQGKYKWAYLLFFSYKCSCFRYDIPWVWQRKEIAVNATKILQAVRYISRRLHEDHHNRRSLFNDRLSCEAIWRKGFVQLCGSSGVKILLMLKIKIVISLNLSIEMCKKVAVASAILRDKQQLVLVRGFMARTFFLSIVRMADKITWRHCKARTRLESTSQWNF